MRRSTSAGGRGAWRRGGRRRRVTDGNGGFASCRGRGRGKSGPVAVSLSKSGGGVRSVGGGQDGPQQRGAGGRGDGAGGRRFSGNVLASFGGFRGRYREGEFVHFFFSVLTPNFAFSNHRCCFLRMLHECSYFLTYCLLIYVSMFDAFCCFELAMFLEHSVPVSRFSLQAPAVSRPRVPGVLPPFPSVLRFPRKRGGVALPRCQFTRELYVRSVNSGQLGRRICAAARDAPRPVPRVPFSSRIACEWDADSGAACWGPRRCAPRGNHAGRERQAR